MLKIQEKNVYPKKKNIMNISIKIILVLIFILLFSNINININNSNILNSEVYASSSEAKDISLDSIITSVKDFFEKGKKGTDKINTDEITDNFIEQIVPIAAALYYVGLGVAVGATMLLGVKYIKAKNDPKETAELKERLIGLTIGIIVLGSATMIWKAVIMIVEKMMNVNI